jgi:diadenosine tetraphosphatase ApaH/serine/threonine PP2A family protein phosphatase
VRYLIISDIHANAQALEAVLNDAAALGYDAAVCLGDLVGYGADPAAVIARVQALAPVGLIRGNHDKVCSGLEPATLFNDAARRAAEWTLDVLSRADRAVLAALPRGPARLQPDVEICHGAPFDEDHYVFETVDAGRAMSAASARLCFFGHTHLPAVFSTPEEPVTASAGEPEELRLPKTGQALINVGSVGQPRDGDPRAAYGILDTSNGTLRLRRVAYDVQGAQKRIRDAGLPEWLAARLARGQ